MPPSATPTESKRRRGTPALYEPLDVVAIRLPLLPVETVADMDLRLPTDGPDPPAAGDAEAFGETTRWRPSRDPRVLRALVVASTQLVEALDRPPRTERDRARLRSSLLRYVLRMSTRPTPFGLFAGSALAAWSETTDLSFGAGATSRTRPDMAWLATVIDQLEAQTSVFRLLRLLANPARLVRDGRIVVANAQRPQAGGKPAQVSLRATGVALRTMEAAARAPIPHDELVEHILTTTTGATTEQAHGLVRQLWETGLLLTDLRPPLTTPRPVDWLLDRLTDVPPARPVRDGLEALIAAAREWDGCPDAQAVAGWGQLSERARRIAPVPGPYFQVDTGLELVGGRVSRRVAGDAARAAELMLRLTSAPRGMAHLDAFRRSFVGRYGTDGEVPLLDALDPQTGLGSPYLRRTAGSEEDPARWRRRTETLFELAAGALRAGERTAMLDDTALERLERWHPGLGEPPSSLDLCVAVAARSAAAIDAGDYLLVVGPNLGAMAAGRHLARFTDTLGPAAETPIRAAARAEEAADPGPIRAELVYTPRTPRSANVVVRPAVRSHEVVADGTPGVDEAHTIPVDDLMLSVHDGRLRLRSRRLDREVVVCSGHMLNYLRAPDVCRFLAEVERDGRPQLTTFDWGAAGNLPFLPRVQVDRIVLRLAEWRITGAAARELIGTADFEAALSRWRERCDVPRQVYLGTGDNRLLLDLDDPAQARELRREIRRWGADGGLSVREGLPGPGSAWVTGPDGHHLAELVVSMVRRPGAARVSRRLPTNGRIPARSARRRVARISADHGPERLRAPGSDWLFMKLFAGPERHDELITGQLGPLIEELMPDGGVRTWFFIRYSDPQPQLRIRVAGEPSYLREEVFGPLCEWGQRLIDGGLSEGFAFDTYEREIARYGGVRALAAIERLFGADSDAAVRLIAADRFGALALDRTTIAVASVDALLASLGLDLPARRAWCRAQSISRQDAPAEYRRRKATLRRALGHPGFVEAQLGGGEIAAALATRRDRVAPVAAELGGLREAQLLEQDWSSLLRSLVHLHLNRLLGVDPAAERRVLELLARTLESLARAPVPYRLTAAVETLGGRPDPERGTHDRADPGAG